MLYFAQLNTRMWAAGQVFRWRSRLLFPRQTVIPYPVSPPARVLVIVKGLLGDSVMCTPVIDQARRIWPSARMTLLGDLQNCELFAACPHLDACQRAYGMPFSISSRTEVKRLLQWIRSRDFDLAIILLGDDFAELIASAGIRCRVGVKGTLLSPFLTHAYDCATPRTWGPSDRLNSLRVLGYEAPDSLPLLWVSSDARESSKQVLQGAGLAPGEPFVVVHPFGSKRNQWWPLESASQLSRTLSGVSGLQTVVIGGPVEKKSLGGRVLDGMVDLVGKLSIEEMVAVIEESQLVVSTDSGPFHIAGALRRPLIGLFRHRRPEHSALYKSPVVFGRDTECERHCRWDHCRRLPCRQMESITCDQVAGEAFALLSRQHPPT